VPLEVVPVLSWGGGGGHGGKHTIPKFNILVSIRIIGTCKSSSRVSHRSIVKCQELFAEKLACRYSVNTSAKFALLRHLSEVEQNFVVLIIGNSEVESLRRTGQLQPEMDRSVKSRARAK